MTYWHTFNLSSNNGLKNSEETDDILDMVISGNVERVFRTDVPILSKLLTLRDGGD